MARIRYLKPDFFKDEDLATLPMEVRLFYAGLWVNADRAGRLEDRPKRLKVEIFPYEDVDIDNCLKQLAHPKGSGKPYIIRYQVEGESFIQIVNWEKHQKPHHTEKESVIPGPMEKGMGMGMGKGMGSVHNPTTTLKNGELTVKEPLKVVIDQKSEWYLSLSTDYKNINIDQEYERFIKWEKDNYRKNHKKAFRNWLNNSEKWKTEKEGKNGRPGQNIESDRGKKLRAVTKVVDVS